MRRLDSIQSMLRRPCSDVSGDDGDVAAVAAVGLGSDVDDGLLAGCAVEEAE